MRTILLLLTAGAAGVFALDATEAPAAADVAALRETIGRIVEVKGRISAERSEWQARKDEMAALLDLHRRELELLDEELEKAGSSAGGFDEKKRETEAELEKLKAARRVAREAVARNRERALALAAKFPQPLAEETEVERADLEAWNPEKEPRDGLQAILGLLTKAEQFNRRITRGRRELDGREMEVLYLGLARAYYADRSGNAGYGVPAEGGWEWTESRELNGEVLKAFDEIDRKRPPELVELPLEILE